MPNGGEAPRPWWGLPGPVRFLERAAAAATAPAGVLGLALPSPAPDGWVEALLGTLDERAASTPLAVDASVGLDGRSPVRMLASAAGLETSGLRLISDFLDDPAVADTVFIVHGPGASDWRQWSLFLRGLRAEREARQRPAAPSVVLAVPPSVPPDDVRSALGGSPLCWMGAVSRLDTRVLVERLAGRPGDDLLSRVAVETTVELAGWDRDMARALCALPLRDQVDPLAALAEHAAAVSREVPCWANGLVDLWDGSPHVSTLALVAAGDATALRSRLWGAQVRAVFPFIDTVRLAYVAKYGAALRAALPFTKMFGDRPVTYEHADRLEFYDLRRLLQHVLPEAERVMLEHCQHMRRGMAHVDPLPAWRIERASELWESLEPDFPVASTGWDWPRCGQGLVLMVGPSGAGKSTYVAETYDPADVVSSDAIREEMFGSVQADGDQGPVFDRVRAEIRARLSAGRRAVVDATHIRQPDRLSNARLAPPDMHVEYVVIDRAMEQKLVDGGWRLRRPGLLEGHAATFRENIEQILARDGLPNVTVTIPPLGGRNTMLPGSEAA